MWSEYGSAVPRHHNASNVDVGVDVGVDVVVCMNIYMYMSCRYSHFSALSRVSCMYVSGRIRKVEKTKVQLTIFLLCYLTTQRSTSLAYSPVADMDGADQVD